MAQLSRKIGEMEYDGLVTGINPPLRVGGGTLAKLSEETVYPRGTLLAKSDTDGLLYILGTGAAAPEGQSETGGAAAGTLTPYGILCDDTAVGTEDDVPVVFYESGCFNPQKTYAAEGYTLTEADRDKFRMYSIVFRAAASAN